MSIPLEIDEILAKGSVVVCCGSGGVGKTTTAASLALRAAESGRKVVVLTIDPARRLAQSMGLEELDNTPRPVAGLDTAKGGSLDAMMLDMKRTFDEIVVAHSEPDKAAAILANPFYTALSSSFAGTQEYMAMEKLGQLKATGRWDLIVVDTPPTRSALDFLDAPARLSTFLDGRLIKILLAPAKAGGKAYLKVVGAGFSIVAKIFTRVVGTQVLEDASAFIAALETMFGGFRDRAEGTYRLLSAPGTSFIVVCAPEADALREASYFIERLQTDRMPLAGVVVNRVHRSAVPDIPAERSMAAAEVIEETHPIAADVLRVHAARMVDANSDERMVSRITRAHPQVPMARVPAMATDVHDLEGLRTIGRLLAEKP